MSNPSTTPPRLHPILGFTHALDGALGKLEDTDPVFMTTEQKKTAVVDLTRQAARIEALRLRVLTSAQDVADADGARNAAAWVAGETRHDYGTAAKALRLAEALDQRFKVAGKAFTAGSVNREQAEVIVQALDALPDELNAEQLLAGEAYLVEQAAFFEPKRLRILGQRLLEVIAPEEADELLGKQLEDEERRARKHTSLFTRKRGDGSTEVHARIPDLVAAQLKAILEGFAAPRRDHLEDVKLGRRDPDTGERLCYGQLLGQAFCSLVEHADPDKLPQHGATATTVVITMSLDKLLKETGVGLLPDGEAISASQVRRLACNAHLIPAVLGTKSEILDLGRSARLFSPAQRKALELRDQHCRAHGCSIPATWCEGHHRNPWSRGGQTDLADGVLLCPFHHHRTHDPAYATKLTANGDYRFHRRT